ncbi:hypothetical protein AB0M02_36125 [Actinoplanes sp. NPDC051861]|uniref:hypothetical protein n=1 Tax=Actinoplanes sp. NPDC051861 TaxID=3155170 RepID=UPI00341706CA
MQPPISLPDPADPPFGAVNEARTFDPFDPAALNWTTAATPEQREAAMAAFGLRLTLTATRAAALLAPARGQVSWTVTTDNGQFVSRTLVLELEPDAVAALHLAGRVENEPEPANLSVLPWHSVSGGAVRVRLLFTFADPALDERVRTQVAALHAGGTLTRACDDDLDLRFVDGVLTPFDLPAGTPEQRHLEPWWTGISAVTWRLRGADPDNKLVDLLPGDVVHLQAQLRDGLSKSATDHWFLCNPGLVLRSLAVAGDPADQANDAAYRVLCGDCVAPVVSGGTPASGGTNPAGDEPLGFAGAVVVHGGSNGGVLLQPPADVVTPGCAFSFTSAEDVRVFSPRLADQVVGLRLWQPTYDVLDLTMVRERVVAGKGNGNDVWVPADNTVILTTEYAAPGRAERYPANRDTHFLPATEFAYGYDGSRARPAEGQPPHELPVAATWERVFNLNETAEIRPEHPRWRNKGSAPLFPTVRRLFPLRVEMSLAGAPDAQPLCTISQDDVDCVRQEYIFHMRFTDYYQDYAVVWRADQLPTRVFPSPTHRIGVDAGGNAVPALGEGRVITVPTRRRVRPVVRQETRYRYSLLVANWQDRIVQAETPGERYATRLRDILADPATLTDIRNAMAAGVDYADPVLPAYAAEIAALVDEFVNAGPFPAGSTRDFLSATLRGQDAIARFTALDPFALQLGSSWRPPEFNESVSDTPISNHQRGEAFDKQPLGAGPGLRNPLAQLCLHMVGQDFFPGLLSEMLLEDQKSKYLSTLFDATVDAAGIARRRYVVIANFLVNGSAEFRLRAPDGTEEELPTQSVLDGEVLTASTRQLSSNLANAFLTAYRSHLQQSGDLWPVPPPTYLETYLFGLTAASHVHFTWR